MEYYLIRHRPDLETGATKNFCQETWEYKNGKNGRKIYTGDFYHTQLAEIKRKMGIGPDQYRIIDNDDPERNIIVTAYWLNAALSAGASELKTTNIRAIKIKK